MARKVSFTRPIRASSVLSQSASEGCNTHPLKGVCKTRPEADDVAGIVAGFKTLSAADRRHALALMSLEQQKTSADAGRDVEMWGEAVYAGLRAAIGGSDGPGHGVQVVRRVLGLPQHWAPISDFMRASGLDGLDATERYSAYRLLANLIVERAKDTARAVGMPLTLKLVAQTGLQVAGLFDNAFPGYVAGGLAKVVVRGLLAVR